MFVQNSLRLKRATFTLQCLIPTFLSVQPSFEVNTKMFTTSPIIVYYKYRGVHSRGRLLASPHLCLSPPFPCCWTIAGLLGRRWPWHASCDLGLRGAPKQWTAEPPAHHSSPTTSSNPKKSSWSCQTLSRRRWESSPTSQGWARWDQLKLSCNLKKAIFCNFLQNNCKESDHKPSLRTTCLPLWSSCTTRAAPFSARSSTWSTPSRRGTWRSTTSRWRPASPTAPSRSPSWRRWTSSRWWEMRRRPSKAEADTASWKVDKRGWKKRSEAARCLLTVSSRIHSHWD